jgi:hypothetical protein
VKAHAAFVAPEAATSFAYHWYVNGEVPPEIVEVNSFCCPTSIVAELGAILTESGPFTVTGTVPDVATAPTESVTFK